ncbi:cupin domain-containing protein [Ruegeria denitrificans]
MIDGTVDAKIGGEWVTANAGDTIHCPRGVSHYMKNNSDQTVRMISYIFPGDRAEEFMAETSRQNETGELDFELIEREFGVVYL